MENKLKVLIVDDTYQSRLAFSKIINESQELVVCGEVDHTDGIFKAVEQLKPDVVIIDIYMPTTKGMPVDHASIESQNGLRQGLKLKNKHPKLGVVFTSIMVHDAAIKLIYSSKLEGGLGFVHKDADESEVLFVVKRVALGYRQVNFEASRSAIEEKKGISKTIRGYSKILGQKEVEVLCEIAKGFSREKTATSLSISAGLLDKHIGNIRDKLRNNNISIGGSSEYSWVHLTHFALAEGLVELLNVEEKI